MSYILAIAFSFTMVVVWALFGLGLFSVMRSRSSFHLRLLLAPALGLALNILILFSLSRIGFSIRQVAFPVLIFGIFLIGHLFIFQKFIFKRQVLISFGLIILAGIIPFAWPLVKFGFEWLAFVNGDMSYYSLSSSRFLDYGYAQLPVSGNIYDDVDHSLQYWYFQNEIGHRSGADLLLAQLVGITGLTAHQIFMPLLIACNVCVGAGAAALVIISSKKWSAALWTMALVVLSPLLTLEITMQLLAQAIGLVLLTGLCASYIKGIQFGGTRAWAGVTILLFSGLAIAYSELIPFFGLFVLTTETIRWRKWMNPTLRNIYLRNMFVLSIGVGILLNSYLFDVLYFVILSIGGSFKSTVMAVQAGGLSLFPHFFVPSSGALLWGWMPLGGEANALIVVAGLVTTLGFLLASMFMSIRGVPSAQMSIVMLTVAVSMYVGGNGFGLFKIAMFIQPFMLATCVVLATLYIQRKFFYRFVLTSLALSLIPAQSTNISKATSDIGQSRVPYASTAHLGEQLREISISAHHKKLKRIYSDTSIREFFLLQSYYFKGIEFSAASLPSTKEFRAEKFGRISNKTNGLAMPVEFIEEHKFYFGQSLTDVPATFKSPGYTDLDNDTLITASAEFSPINRFIQLSGRKIFLEPLSRLENHLVFKQTSLGTSYIGKRGLADGGVVLWGIEPDPMFVAKTMASVGRYHLYEVLGSQDNSRVLLSLSASMNRNDDFRLPAVRAIGSSDSLLPLQGRGSARVISSPVGPRQIGGSNYLGIDFGREGSFLERERSGVMGWFGKDIKLDIRKTVAFARNISYVSPALYTAIRRPETLQSFPAALTDDGLEYSGIFEDAWMSEIAYIVLNAAKKDVHDSLYISGLIPDINGAPFTTSLTIKVNGSVVYKKLHEKGHFKIFIPTAKLISHTEGEKVQIESDALQRLPGGDDRPVSLRLSEIGFIATPRVSKLD